MAGVYQKFGEFIRERREALGYSQEAVSGYLGLSRSAIANMERGIHKPQLEHALKLSRFLEFSLDQYTRVYETLNFGETFANQDNETKAFLSGLNASRRH